MAHIVGADAVCPGPLDLALLIDSSGSLTETQDLWEEMKNFLKSLLLKFRIDGQLVRVGIVMFSNIATEHLDFNLGSSLSGALIAVDNMPYMGSTTNFAGGLNSVEDWLFSTRQGDRADVFDAVLLVTDGEANERALETMSAAARVRRHAQIVSVGVGSRVNGDELAMISQEERNVFLVSSFAHLLTMDTSNDIAERLCGQPLYIVPPTPILGFIIKMLTKS